MTQLHEKIISVRVTTEQFQTIELAAKLEKMSPGPFLRQAGCAAATGQLSGKKRKTRSKIRRDSNKRARAALDKKTAEVVASRVDEVMTPQIVYGAKWLAATLAGKPVPLSWTSLVLIAAAVLGVSLLPDVARSFGPHLWEALEQLQKAR